MVNIVILDSYAAAGVDLSRMSALGNFTVYDYTEPSQVVERCREADVAIANKTPFDAATLKALPRLKLIAVAATGTNNVDTKAAEALGVKVMNAVGYSTDTVAEATLAAVLGLLRNVCANDRLVKSGAYTALGRTFDLSRKAFELKGKTWGIVGLGHIGRRVAEIATAFGTCVLCYSASGGRYQSPYRQVDLDMLLSESDILSIHTPLTEKTFNLIDYPQILRMKPGAVICNMARGGIVNEAGLVRALNENRIAGAAIDVYTREPVALDNPLLHADDPDKLLLSPHSAWGTQESILRLYASVEQNIRSFLEERSLL